MASFITLVRFTEKGRKHIKDTCKRAAEFRTDAKKRGVEIKEQLWCMGNWDGVITFDAPSDEAATAAMLFLGSQENVTTQTMRCFSAAEMSKIIGTLS